MKKILVPTDFSKTAAIALDTAADIAKKSGAELILIHVVEQASGGSFNVAGQVAYDTFEDRLFNFKLIEKAQKQLEKVVLDPKYSDVKLNGELRFGNPFHGIRAIIAEQKVDLIVMGTAGHTKLEEVIIGTNTEKVVRISKCPVLTVNKKPATSNFKNIVYATAMGKDEEVFCMIQPYIWFVSIHRAIFSATLLLKMVWQNLPSHLDLKTIH
jgi:nucleotide-binding universal stress UspA family protein